MEVQNNVLYEPVIRAQNQAFADEMDADDTVSMHTNVGSKAYE